MAKKQSLREDITRVALDILWLWNSVYLEAETSSNPAWHKIHGRQAYQDAINSMKNRNLIEDYNMCKVAVKVNGIWIHRS